MYIVDSSGLCIREHLSEGLYYTFPKNGKPCEREVKESSIARIFAMKDGREIKD